jgi:hypothetical protein
MKSKSLWEMKETVNYSNFSAISWQEQVHFQWDVLSPQAGLGVFLIVLAHWNNSPTPWIDMSPHSDTLIILIRLPIQPVFAFSL